MIFPVILAVGTSYSFLHPWVLLGLLILPVLALLREKSVVRRASSFPPLNSLWRLEKSVAPVPEPCSPP